jgi:hypothetical protein
MRRLPHPADLLDQVGLSSREQLAFRAAVPVATLLLVAVFREASGRLHPVLGAVALLLAVVAAVSPGSDAALGLVLYLGAMWLLTVPERLDPWTPAVALLLCLIHLGCTLASYGPPGMTLDRRLLRRWRARLLGCLAAAVLLWGAALLISSLGSRGGPVALALGLGALVGWVLVVRLRVPGPDPASLG